MIAIGIDLGTTNSVIASVENGQPYVLSVDSGHKTLPSVVSYVHNPPLVGRAAVMQQDNSSTVFSVKRLMGSSEKILGRTPEEISAELLMCLRKAAEDNFGQPITSAVITVPAHFSDAQRIATQHAASLAGIKVLRLVNEPTAAAIAFGLDQEQDGIFAVYDLGGGTFDFSILRLQSGVFQVLATGGDNYLGGDDIDNLIVDYNVEKLSLHDLTTDERKYAKLVAKHMKEHLASSADGCIDSHYNFRGTVYTFSLSQSVLSTLIDKLLKRTFSIADDTLRDASLNSSELNGVVLVGGMTKLESVRMAVREHFSQQIFCDINPDEAVALGAALQAESIQTKNKRLLLIDVVPLTLGVETFGGGVDKIIHRNTPIPTVEKREYTTYCDNQQGMQFHVLQGESSLAEGCRSLAKFELRDIPPLPAGIARVEVLFSVDVNGLLTVSAREKQTGVSQTVLISPSTGLTQEQMIELLEKAYANRKADDEKAHKIFIKVETERILLFWESIIEEVPADERNAMRQRIDGIKTAIAQEDIDTILSLRRDMEKHIGCYLDDIINSRLSGQRLDAISKTI